MKKKLRMIKCGHCKHDRFKTVVKGKRWQCRGCGAVSFGYVHFEQKEDK